MDNAIRFLLDGEVIAIEAPDPTGTLLDLLRYRMRRTGTKEGCAEGDCGACTVALGSLHGDTVRWRAVNACILFLPMLDGKALITVESLSKGGALHPIQRALADGYGSQCGFCTPGFVMSLYARSIAAEGTEDLPVGDVLAGNLCRCTGYGPILAVGEAHPPAAPAADPALVVALRGLQRDAPLTLRHPGRTAFVPRTSDELSAFVADNPAARIVAGATDVGLWVTKQLREIDSLVFVGDVADLKIIDETPDGITLGANVRYSEARAALARLHPDLGELVRRIGGLQVRNAGTIGGNIANGSPIGDMPPALIALGATLTLRHGDARRTLPLADFFLAYGRQDRVPGEWVERIHIPQPPPGALLRIVKLSKRFDSDISSLCAAFLLPIADGRIGAARVAFGGMAGIPSRAPACEAALSGQPWSAQTLDAAAEALRDDFAPLDDLRGSAEYRLAAAGNLLRRLWHEQADIPALAHV
ncbi:xanthine dehydrogenase small subunit [Sphingomonas hengshuiensis]|uniref:FAD-binding molybdopterin dehydrogenase n=1 Tax=Sphingomonas hengshuiensis TaxID=1609977 RepID=A0A7U4LE53_9SPHN|nr:xanthine dehydrogenase small subunit [Sphingomonas hengshuiensis]AJP71109.1 FAD-binding molybdopterin dehydrogenase [Sphingomonas hengshuiensis]